MAPIEPDDETRKERPAEIPVYAELNRKAEQLDSVYQELAAALRHGQGLRDEVERLREDLRERNDALLRIVALAPEDERTYIARMALNA